MKGLIAFDLEGTLTDMISWEILHEKFGTCDKARVHTSLFLSGKITYHEWAEMDVRLWKGRRREEVEEAFSQVTLKPYARELFEWLKKNNFKTAIISGGLMCLARKVGEKLGVDFIVANELKFDSQGRIEGVIVRVTFDNKGEILRQLKQKVNPNVTIAVGDWKNDKSMFEEADISISLGDIDGDYKARDLRDVLEILKSIVRNI
ncbi:phosphoserine phosphatase [Pyrococcus furiosus DSM 3638]|uniref:phosphoserine phosphatase n=3 Tax=Pyrococcus furiosus TaxID=2261 RepID=A0A5C0XQK2_PYRFU|nr:HAD-IB family phosphatase [Pyrococcus furiosus]AAL82045.1 phosphoserine phosphatase [Pyrococcus furiosus DSM 3638]AFN04719.1 phosphoserine phosphatase [Pyrococcus furiosus COM1]QEK79516.1 phosphoserine phosphatase [Pyrococcus furiosus DSM 3638]